MLESIYIGLTGLTGYSKDLSVIGNNAANLNTPGFKSQQLSFTDLFYQAQAHQGHDGNTRFDIGAGMDTGSTRRNFKQGELRETGGEQDAAIQGNGFFVLRKDGETFYTRAGQFSFDEQGFLISSTRKARVAGFSAGALRDISVSGQRTQAGLPTARMAFVGVLNTNDSSSSPHTVSSIQAFDAAGGSHTLRASFTNDTSVTPGSWRVSVQDENGATLTSGEIRFDGAGTPSAGFNTLAFDWTPTGVTSSRVELFFGDPGSVTGARSLSAAASDLRFDTQDGRAVGALTRATFDTQGFLVLNYSNGGTQKADRLALASFRFLQGLEPREGNLFAQAVETPGDRTLGVAGEGVFGSIASGRIEISNVDLAQEFSDLIISQRGYQASSQVIGAANEMIQQLFEMKSKR